MEKKAHLLTRQEVPDQYKWRLEDIYVTDDLWEQDFLRVQKLAGEIETFRGRLGQSAMTLLEALRMQDCLQELDEKVYTYAHMRRDEENSNHVYQALTDRADSLNTRVETALSFIVPEILGFPTGVLERFLQEEPELSVYNFALDEILRMAPHTLSAAEEQIIAQAGEVIQAPANIFKMINNADLTFPSIRDEEGKELEVTHGRYLQLMESRDRRVRQETFSALYSSYRKLKNTLAATLSNSVKRDVFYARVRKYTTALEAALFADNIPPEVYENLIETVRRNFGSMRRYLDLRKKLLGLDELHMYDLYTPVVRDVRWDIPYQKAVALVQEGLAPLGVSYGETLAGGFVSGWVDVYENKAKTSGAYSWGPYGVHPYVLMNYQDNLNNVFTLAHEMGHALHSYYSYREQPYVYAHYKIFTAEVASTVNESLLMDHLLKTETDHNKKLYLLNHYLEEFRGTVFRQTMFAEFEKMIHEKVEAGAALTPALLCEIYHQLNVDYYGAGIVVDEDVDLEWARIPHFYSAFYVYKYAIGFSAATALTRQILEEGEPAVSRYLNFLKMGGSRYPIDLLKFAGVDMATPHPVQEGLDLFAHLVSQMEELTAQ
ncbi:MAG: Oligoendopeptidase F, plasmid [Pelotomaculum sp. PtaU1.Bin035]|nr:MAG: Oligoendopeptidase F, plasmid [Pelotomaculum sp. PtaU1.Bin035]